MKEVDDVMQSTPTEGFDARHYAELRDAGQQAVFAGRVDEARAFYTQAYELARLSDDDRLVDRALCNMAATQIEDGSEHNELLPQLRAILVRNADLENSRLAAYHLARAYENRKDFKKGLFYARIAREHTKALTDVDEWTASSYNQLGNLLVAESRFAEAMEHYRMALDIHPPSELRRALIRNNVGYCQLMLGRHRDAFELLYDSLRAFRRQGAEEPQLRVELDLCLAHLEVGRHRDAIRHGARALHLAERYGHESSLKNSLYLLGEASHLIGDEAQARQLFERLQVHYPDTPFVADFLLAVDVRKMVNLRA